MEYNMDNGSSDNSDNSCHDNSCHDKSCHDKSCHDKSCQWKYILHFNNIWRIPNGLNEKIIFTNSGINFKAIQPNDYLNIVLVNNDEDIDHDYDEYENDSVS